VLGMKIIAQIKLVILIFSLNIFYNYIDDNLPFSKTK